ncbi:MULTISPECIES: SGNH/GDSL hydrolase family protein [unclassified Mycolicibacterium]|uniref:SGNH/GDSL hydrolase family protein n=1 Tax=unclassified Mycolicibacterium TaxID=2636767 RepID=UPI0013908A75|nr:MULTISPECIES: SGNH/GDSL hydrolase family protein [unclassified Mycolicibacterium]
MLFSIVLLAWIVGVGCVQWRRNDVSTHGQGPGSTVPTIGSMFDYKPTLLVVGDSFAGGTGDPTFRTYPYLLGDLLGWNLTVDAQGGTGFVNATGNGKSRGVPFIDRLARDGQLYNVDYVLIDGGRNDLGLPPVDVIPAADEYIKKVRATWPQAKIILILPSYVSAEEASNYSAVSAGLRRTAEEVDAHVIDPVAEGWYRGKDLAPLFWKDGIHLNAKGNEYYANRIIDNMRAMGLAK